MVIYRVNKRDRVERGLYMSYTSTHLHDLNGAHCTPTRDSQLMANLRQLCGEDCDYIESCFRFGFASIEQLKFWIYNKEWRESLDAENYVVSVIDASWVAYGDTQAIFDYEEDWKVVEVLKLTEI